MVKILKMHPTVLSSRGNRSHPGCGLDRLETGIRGYLPVPRPRGRRARALVDDRPELWTRSERYRLPATLRLGPAAAAYLLAALQFHNGCSRGL